MNYYFIDLFAGAGGVTTGISRTRFFSANIAKVIYCINHDKKAIASHALNHPECIHTSEDIRTAALQPLIDLVSEIRRKDPKAVICIWASLECTNHSKAKGHVNRDADSRTLANHLFRYFVLNPDMIWIENVKEFIDWGPLEQKRDKDGNLVFDKNGAPVMIPIKEKKGIDYNKWVKRVKKYNYQYDMKLINAADYGSPQKRHRIFIQFSKPHINIKWPTQTHDKLGRNSLPQWVPVAPLLDLKESGQSIFKESKVSEKSLEKIFISLKRFVPKRAKHWLFDYQYKNVGNSIEEPCPTLIARQDKKPKYILSAERNKTIIKILSNDSYMEKEIKKFLIENKISDIKMRQLTVEEMLKIMGFPDGYKLVGTIADKKKFIGNAVPTDIVKKLIEESVNAN